MSGTMGRSSRSALDSLVVAQPEGDAAATGSPYAAPDRESAKKRADLTLRPMRHPVVPIVDRRPTRGPDSAA